MEHQSFPVPEVLLPIEEVVVPIPEEVRVPMQEVKIPMPDIWISAPEDTVSSHVARATSVESSVHHVHPASQEILPPFPVMHPFDLLVSQDTYYARTLAGSVSNTSEAKGGNQQLPDYYRTQQSNDPNQTYGPPPDYQAAPGGGNRIGQERSSATRNNPPRRSSDDNDVEDDSDDEYDQSAFDDQLVRSRFVRRVYFILTIQMLVTSAIIAWFVFHMPTKRFARKYPYLALIPMLVYAPIYCALVCSKSLRHKYPINFVLFSVFTIAMAFVCGFVSASTDTKIVLIAFGTTAGICILITILAIISPWDITGYGCCLYICTMVLTVYGVVAFIINIFLHLPILTMVYSGLTAVVFCAWLMYDTQQIMGGRKIQIRTDEYICAALSLYMDIIIIFLSLVNLLTALSRN